MHQVGRYTRLTHNGIGSRTPSRSRFLRSGALSIEPARPPATGSGGGAPGSFPVRLGYRREESAVGGHFAATLQRPPEGELVGVLEVASDGEPTGQAGHP